MSNPLIVALDVSGEEQALKLVDTLQGSVGFFKVGLQLYTALGPEILRKITQKGGKVFLDLKFHDIPNTVARAAIEGARLGASMMTLHGLGGERMMSQARETLHKYFQREGGAPPKLLAVTILTSMDQAELATAGIDRPLEEMVVRLAKGARNSGLDGIVASRAELPALKEAHLEDLLFVIPGIRPPILEPDRVPQDDQNRTASVSEALEAGADYVVIGRPITQAPDPFNRVRAMLEEIRRAKMRGG